jgi:hypothetical protein
MQYLSPSSIKTFDNDVEDFVLKYVLRIPREPQTKPMSVGSAFDAYAKSHIHHCLFGHYGDYSKEAIFEAQVEPCNRDWARSAGQDCFDKYVSWGAMDALMAELAGAVGPPRFEFTVQGSVEDVPLLGKPDLAFVNSSGVRVVYDWKVNGYCGSYNTSPAKGYVVSRPKGVAHKGSVFVDFKGIKINAMLGLEDVNKEWADQLSIYGWLLGEPVGSENIIYGIDQITGPGCSRVSSHRVRIRPKYQFNFLDRIKQIWVIIESGWLFRELDRSGSDAKIEELRSMWVDNPISELL